MEAHPAPLFVATLNLMRDGYGWPRRAQLAVDCLASRPPHLLSLQEVWLPVGQADWIAGQLNERLALPGREGFSVFARPKWGRDQNREAVSLLTRIPPIRHDGVDLPEGRVAVCVDVPWQGATVRFVSVHLHYGERPDHAEGVRRSQLRELFSWLTTQPPVDETIIAGDFNATPSSPVAAMMYERFRSAYAVARGREPEWTFGTRLAERTHRDRGLPVFHGTLDYVFVPLSASVRSASLICDTPAPEDPELFASDHVGISAEVVLGAAPAR